MVLWGGLNDLIDEIHVYFPDRLLQEPSLWSWKRIGPPFMAPIHLVFVVTERGQQMVTLDAQTEKN